MVAFKDPLTVDIGFPSNLGSSFVIEIQTHDSGSQPVVREVLQDGTRVTSIFSQKPRLPDF